MAAYINPGNTGYVASSAIPLILMVIALVVIIGICYYKKVWVQEAEHTKQTSTHNSGRTIKGLAIVFCVLGIIAGLFIAVGAYKLTMTLTGGVFSDGDAGVSLLVAVAVFAVSALLSWLSYILLYGFGELISETCYTRAALESLTEELEASGSAKKLNKSSKKEAASTTTDHANKASHVQHPQSDKKYCPYCGKPLTDNYCSDCLAYFED